MFSQRSLHKVISALSLIVLLIVASLPRPIARVQAQSNCQTFMETAMAACGKFLTYWQAHGALPQQGYPISEQIQDVSETDGKTYTVQYFERAVFELHPEFAGTENEVLLQLLGTFLYDKKYPQGAPGQAASTDNPSKDDVTAKTVGGKFRAYYEANGGIRQQGRPLSDQFQEKSDLDGKTYTVQYFERAVFELHPENPAPYDVLLSQLGTFRYRGKQSTGSPPTPAPQGTLQPTQIAPEPTATLGQPTAEPTAQAVEPPRMSAEFIGTISDANNPMVKPVGLAVDGQDDLYVLSAGHADGSARVFEFDPEGHFLRNWPAPVNVSSGFNNEIFGDLDVDAQGNVYVAQAGGVPIEKYDNNGNHLQSIGGAGNGDGLFTRTIGVAVDAQGNIYALDDRHNTIQKFDSQGRYLAKTNQVHNTGNAATDAQGALFVADYGTTQVKKFDSNLQLVAKWTGGLQRPEGIDTDRAGNIFVSNEGTATIVEFDAAGRPVGFWGTRGRDPGQIGDPFDVTVDSQGNIYVADGLNHNVQKYRLP